MRGIRSKATAIGLILLGASLSVSAGEPMKVKPKMSHKPDRDRYEHHDRRHDRERNHQYHGRHYDREHRPQWNISLNWHDGGFGIRTYDNHRKKYGKYNKHRSYRPWGHRPWHSRKHHSVHDYSAPDWITAFRFSTGARHHGEQAIHLDARVSAISLIGRARDASIDHIYAELTNGRIVSLYALQGHLSHGKHKGRYYYFDRPRHIKRIFLSVSSAHRHGPAHLELSYVDAGRTGYHGR